VTQPSLPEWAQGLRMARPVMGSGVLYRDGSDRLVLVKPSYKEGWDLPGGIVEPGESPHQAVCREVVEELGTALPVGRLLVVDWAPDDVVGDKLLWVFDGGVLADAQLAALRVDGEELLDAAAHPAADLEALCPPRLARRIRTAMAALDAVDGVYAELGAPFDAPGR